MPDRLVPDDAKLNSFWQPRQGLGHRERQTWRYDRAVVQNPQVTPVVRRARRREFFKRRAIPDDHARPAAVERQLAYFRVEPFGAPSVGQYAYLCAARQPAPRGRAQSQEKASSRRSWRVVLVVDHTH